MRKLKLMVAFLVGFVLILTMSPPHPISYAQSTLAPTGSSTEATLESTNNPHFITFQEFLTLVANAKFDDYAQLSGSKVRDAQAFEEMRKHILDFYAEVKVVSSFILDDQSTTSSVSYFDCITIDSQPSVLRGGVNSIATPPDASNPNKDTAAEQPGTETPIDTQIDPGTLDQFGNSVLCPKGTVPIKRVTLETLVRFKTLKDFFSKDRKGGGGLPPQRSNPDQPPETGASSHKYAHAFQTVSNFGGDSWLNLWNPIVGDSAEFSLSQQWYAGGTGNSTQTVEGGWQVYEDSWNTKQAVLFIYWTANNYGHRGAVDPIGCYNVECVGFVQINNNWYLGGRWDHYSQSGETQWGFEMQWKYYNGNWWLFLKGRGNYEAVGYLPGTVFNGGQMSKSADSVDYGGEVTGTKQWYEMGSGQFANDGWTKAAFQKGIFYISRDENDGVGVWTNLSASEPSPSCYTIDITPSGNGGNWGTYFFFGGPGGNSC